MSDETDQPIVFNTGVPIPPPPAQARRRRWPIVIAIVVVVALVGAGAIVLANRGPSGPPGAPGKLQAAGNTCSPPKCDSIASTVTLTWAAPSTGSPVTGYRVFRDGTQLQTSLSAGTTRYVDGGVSFGQEHTYKVVARSAVGDSPASGDVQVKTPRPPLSAAQLSGSFKVHLIVVSESNVDEIEGIHHPSAGDKKTETWVFATSCAQNTGPCPTKWYSEKPPLKTKGLAYSGTVQSVDARCQTGSSVDRPHSYATFKLKIKKASIEGEAWKVSSFQGTYVVSFSCPGGVASRGEFKVTGSE